MDGLLLESGDDLLLESGSRLLTQTTQTIPPRNLVWVIRFGPPNWDCDLAPDWDVELVPKWDVRAVERKWSTGAPNL